VHRELNADQDAAAQLNEVIKAEPADADLTLGMIDRKDSRPSATRAEEPRTLPRAGSFRRRRPGPRVAQGPAVTRGRSSLSGLRITRALHPGARRSAPQEAQRVAWPFKAVSFAECHPPAHPDITLPSTPQAVSCLSPEHAVLDSTS